MSLYEVQLSPYAITFLKSISRSSASDDVLKVLRARTGIELVYAATDSVAIISGLTELSNLALMSAKACRNPRESAEVEAARKGLDVARDAARRHLRKLLANRPT